MQPHLKRSQAPAHRIDSPGAHGPKAARDDLCAAPVLLPGEDAQAFIAMRQEMFDLHKPHTGNEARCVEAMADHEWSMERCRRIRRHYQGKLIEMVEGTGTAHCEKDPHRWHHSAMDCSLDERRIAKLQREECEKLETLQKLRRQNLVQSAEREAIVQPREVVVLQREATPPGKSITLGNTVQAGGDDSQSRPGQAEESAELPATGSSDMGNFKKPEKIESREQAREFDGIAMLAGAEVVALPPNFTWSDVARAGYTGVGSG